MQSNLHQSYLGDPGADHGHSAGSVSSCVGSVLAQGCPLGES